MLIDGGRIGRALNIGLVAGDGGPTGGLGVGRVDHGVFPPIPTRVPAAPPQQQQQGQQAEHHGPARQAEQGAHLFQAGHASFSVTGTPDALSITGRTGGRAIPGGHRMPPGASRTLAMRVIETALPWLPPKTWKWVRSSPT